MANKKIIILCAYLIYSLGIHAQESDSTKKINTKYGIACSGFLSSGSRGTQLFPHFHLEYKRLSVDFGVLSGIRSYVFYTWRTKRNWFDRINGTVLQTAFNLSKSDRKMGIHTGFILQYFDNKYYDDKISATRIAFESEILFGLYLQANKHIKFFQDFGIGNIYQEEKKIQSSSTLKISQNRTSVSLSIGLVYIL